MALKRKDGESQASNKKGKRVGFASIDNGVEANECVKVFLVNSADEVDNANSVPLDLVDVNQFFDEDGKIYGYKDLKINVWLSSISFHAYANITFQSTYDGGKGITDLKAALQKIFGESIIEKQEFLQTFTSEVHYIRNAISSGMAVRCDACKVPNITSGTHSDVGSTIEVIHMDLSSMHVGLLYSRLVPLVFLLVDGGSPIDITDPRWEIYFVVKKIPDQSGEALFVVLGFSTVYRFYHYPDSTRLRIGQILVFPPYQGQGHGCRLLESINSVAISENAYDVTAEEPSDYLQYLRACIDSSRLVSLEPIRAAVTTVVSYLKEGYMSKGKRKLKLDPPANVIEVAREKLKINKKQFLRCWEVLIFLNLDTENQRCMEDFKSCVADRVKGDIIGKDAGSNGKRLIELPNPFGQDTTFVVFQPQGADQQDSLEIDNKVEGDKANQEQQLNQLVDERLEEIARVAQKVLLHVAKGGSSD